MAEAVAGHAKQIHPGRLETPMPAGRRGAQAESWPTDHAPQPSEVAAVFGERFTASGGEVVVADRGRAREEWLRDFILGLGVGPGGAGEAGGDSTAANPAVAVATDVPARWRPQLPVALPAEADVGVAIAWGAAAETGTLVLTPDGGRAAQLLPPVLVVWVPAERVLAKLDDVLSGLRKPLPAVVGLHSGPSKSADIGRTVVTGVHGPGRCIAVLDFDDGA